MKLRFFIIGALIAASLQTAALGKMIYDRATLLRTGQEVVLETGFVDPRDLFRGHYVTLNLRISRINPKTLDTLEPFRRGDTVYIELEKGEALFAKPKRLTRNYPTAAKGPVIEGTARSSYINAEDSRGNLRIEFPFDRYFAPKLRAKQLEDLRRDQRLGIILSLGADGKGAIKGITIDSKKIYEEPLF